MTFLVVGVALIVTLASAQVSEWWGRAAKLGARVQIAADAAALAAVAESAPGGRGDPDGLAAEYAELNGGRLVECACPPGATEMQVTVYLEGHVASARAVLDPSALFPLVERVDGTGLDPRLEHAVQELLVAGRGAIRVVSGWRSTADQAALWAEALAKYGSPEAADDWVAPPGSSMHERGLAVDLGGDVALAASLVDDLHLPLWRPLPNEPWHFELSGSRG
jgi:hypothetical protein